MRIFCIKALYFTLGLIVFYAIAYLCFNAYLNRFFSNNEAVFIWGDSQAYQGIDLYELSSTLKKDVYTCAHHGAGVYDFLKFTKQVPDNSEVIVSISKLVQVRRKENDFNRSGLSLWALKSLYDNNYSTKELITILILNLKPRCNIRESTQLYNYSDSIQVGYSVELFESYYQKIPHFLNEKQNVHLVGIQNLINKNCKISFIEFPYHKKIERIENLSPIKPKTDNFINEIGKLFAEYEVDSIDINKGQNIFADLDHLNCIGAKDLSRKLGESLLRNKCATMYIAH